MTKQRNWNRRIATQKAKEARANQRAAPARRQVEQQDFGTSRTAAAKKPRRRGLSVKGWKPRRKQLERKGEIHIPNRMHKAR